MKRLLYAVGIVTVLIAITFNGSHEPTETERHPVSYQEIADTDTIVKVPWIVEPKEDKNDKD